ALLHHAAHLPARLQWTAHNRHSLRPHAHRHHSAARAARQSADEHAAADGAASDAPDDHRAVCRSDADCAAPNRIAPVERRHPMFKETLQRLIDRTEGATGALIMGTDGIAVEKVLLQEARDANLDVAAAEFTSLLRSARRVGEDTGIGHVQELIVGFDDMKVLIRSFTRDYFAVLALKED